MHSATLAIAAYALLASSFVSLSYLLKEKFKKCVMSPLHIFSMSDALSSICAAIIFLVNQLNMNSTIHLEENDVSNVTKYNRDIFNVFKSSEGEYKRNEIKIFQDCQFKYVMMQYGMFFIPFTNAFITLLGYSFHYITNIIRVDGFCMEIIKPIEQIMNKEIIIKHRESMETLSSPGTSANRKRSSNFESIISPDKIETAALDVLKETTFNQSSKYDKMTLISVVIEWLLPIIITAILHFGEYQRLSEKRNLKNAECIFATNFPFDNCYFLPNQSDSFSSSIFYNSTPNVAVYNYIETEDSFQMDNQNFEEIDKVVSNVYQLVQTALDRNERKNLSSFKTSDLWNITRFMEKNSTSSENRDENELKLFEDVEKAANEIIFERITNEDVGKTGDDSIFDPCANLSSENDLKDEQNLKSETVHANIKEQTDNIDFETSTKRILDKKNLTDYNSHTVNFNIEKTVSQNEIFADLMEKIKNGIQKVKTNRTRLNRKIQLNQTEFSIPQNELQCSTNHCFISTRFLKIHLFILLFIVYFIPIFTSTILNVCATYKFKQIKEKVETNCVTLKILTNFGKEKVEEKNKHENYKDTIDVKKVAWFQRKTEDFSKIKETEEDETSSMEIEIIKEEEIFINILEDLKKVEKFSKIFKINLFLAILLWTPLFMEVLTKVFLCMKVPNWLMDSSFLGAVSFGIVRNFLNINMIKTLRIAEKTQKGNSVHPTS